MKLRMTVVLEMPDDTTVAQAQALVDNLTDEIVFFGEDGDCDNLPDSFDIKVHRARLMA